MPHENATLGEIIKHYEDVISRMRRHHQEAFDRFTKDGDAQADLLQRHRKTITDLRDKIERIEAEKGMAGPSMTKAPKSPQEKPWWKRII